MVATLASLHVAASSRAEAEEAQEAAVAAAVASAVPGGQAQSGQDAVLVRPCLFVSE